MEKTKYKFGEFVKRSGDERTYQILSTVGEFVTIISGRRETYLEYEKDIFPSTAQEYILTSY